MHQGSAFADIRRGVFLIRGENVVLLGEIVRPNQVLFTVRHNVAQDLDQEDVVPLQSVPLANLQPLHKEEQEARKRRETIHAKILYEQKGFCKEGGEGDGY